MDDVLERMRSAANASTGGSARAINHISTPLRSGRHEAADGLVADRMLRDSFDDARNTNDAIDHLSVVTHLRPTRDLDWRERPGQVTGMSPNQKIADPDYIARHYYLRTEADGRVSLAVNPNRSPDADGMRPPRVDLEKGLPKFKSDRPPAESLGFDEERSRILRPQPVNTNAAPRGYLGTQGWRPADYREIDSHLSRRQEAMEAWAKARRDTPDGSQERSDAIRTQTKVSERFGEQVSAHAIRERVHGQFAALFPDTRIEFRHADGGEFDPSHTSRKTVQAYDAETGKVFAEIEPMHSEGTPGNSNFDQIWKLDYQDGNPPDYVIHEAKAPAGPASERTLHTDDGIRVVQQGHPDYFEDTLQAMERRTDDEALLADELRKAKRDGRLDYLEVRSQVDESGQDHEFDGWKYRPFDGYDYQPRFPLE
ncbi:hypothetical protein [Nocardia sp. NPDC057440]|uniref:hypothetical protein n=1 Tax=Nocardia sp. NPDC057440 TaxID=3346134 RepID=UPI00366BF03B